MVPAPVVTHVLYDGHEAKYWLEPQVELAKNTGIADHKLNEIRKIVEKYADEFKNNTESTSVSVLMINAQGIMISGAQRGQELLRPLFFRRLFPVLMFICLGV